MEYISAQNFVKTINEGVNVNLLLELKGIISTEIMIENVKVFWNENEMMFKSLKDNNVNVKLNIHQIVRIKQINKDKYSIDFDEIQKIGIKLKWKDW